MLKERVGFTGAALDLIEAGVKQVVAMRYEVGDRYARRLARRFYRRLLAGPAHPSVDAALAMARGELARDEKRRREYDAVDHAGAATAAMSHQLAYFAYGLVTGLQQRSLLGKLALHVRQSVARGEPFVLPRIIDLLADPAFADLCAFLAERGISLDKLQDDIDWLVGEMHAPFTAPPTSDAPPCISPEPP
jgi:CHAT domain-containing protein